MRGANETKGKIGRDWNLRAYRHRLEILQRVLRFLERVKRQGRIVLRLLRLTVETGVFFLQVTGVEKDDSAQINDWRGCVNRSAKSLFHQPTNPSAVVDVGLRQDDRIDFVGTNRRDAPIALAPLFRTLEDAAIERRGKKRIGRFREDRQEWFRSLLFSVPP